MASATERLAKLAGEFNSSATCINDDTLELQIELLRADGRNVKYTIVAYADGPKVRAKEKAPQHLPSFCPERHINIDGSFCLYWEGDSSLDVVDEASAMTWWETLYEFLLQQERAAKLRHWPTTEGWAHGDAAKFQQRAIEAAVRLGTYFVDSLREGKLKIVPWRKMGKNQDSTLRLYREGVFLYSVWASQRRVVNKKQRCFCKKRGGRHRYRLRTCSTHAVDGADLVLALNDWERSEADFWRYVGKENCCGTCDECPLNKSSPKQEASV